MRIVIISKVPSPYRTPLFEQLGQTIGCELHVIYLAEEQKNRAWKVFEEGNHYEISTLKKRNFRIDKLDWQIDVGFGVWRRLNELKPNIVICHGYEAPAFWQALFWCKLKKVKCALWTGATLESLRVTSPIVDGLRTVFIQNSDMYITYGTESSELVTKYGGMGKIFQGLNTIDADTFQRRVLSSASEKPPSRNAPYQILFVGRLVALKRVEIVLESLSGAKTLDYHLHVVGDGPMKKSLEKMAADLLDEQRVTFHGYVQYEDLPPHYANADMLILNSDREIWGLVVNEGLISGLPVVVSRKCGCVRDIVDADAGIVVRHDDPDGIRNAILELEKNKKKFREDRRVRMKTFKEALRMERYVSAFESAIEYGLEKR